MCRYNRNMKVCVIVLIALIGIAFARPEDAYTTKYDNVDIDNILHNDRLLTNYVHCLLDKGNCTPEGADLKAVLKEALDTECAKCNDKQKSATKKVIHFLIKNKRDMWDDLQVKYDPENKYVKKYEAELKAEGITL